MKTLGLGTAAIIILGISALLDQGSGVRIWLELRDDLAQSELRVADLVSQNEAMGREIGMLEAEPAAIDRAIREELDLALPGEVVIRFTRAEAEENEQAGRNAQQTSFRQSMMDVLGRETR